MTTLLPIIFLGEVWSGEFKYSRKAFSDKYNKNADFFGA